MKTVSTLLIGAGLAATMLVGFTSNCLAQGEPEEIFPGLWQIDDGIYVGNERFPDTAFVVAEHGGTGFADQHICTYDGSYTGDTISDMEVVFETKDSGLAHVSFCGALDVDGSPGNLRLAAKIDGADDCISIKGVNPWNVEGGSTGNSGPICWEWICGVTNDEGRGNKPIRTEHTVTVHCASNAYRAKFNDRSTFVNYTYIHSN